MERVLWDGVYDTEHGRLRPDLARKYLNTGRVYRLGMDWYSRPGDTQAAKLANHLNWIDHEQHVKWIRNNIEMIRKNTKWWMDHKAKKPRPTLMNSIKLFLYALVYFMIIRSLVYIKKGALK